jgi:hypothetical protein
VPDVASTSPLDLDAILAMFPTNSTNNHLALGSSNDTVDSAQANANTMANPWGVGESRAGADNVNQPLLEYFDFQDRSMGIWMDPWLLSTIGTTWIMDKTVNYEILGLMLSKNQSRNQTFPAAKAPSK